MVWLRFRRATPSDLPAVARIQGACPEAAQWDPAGYELLVAEHKDADGDIIAGFLVWRETSPTEAEILNIAVAPEYRRRGVATSLIECVPKPEIFLEVRESNHAARALYVKAGLEETGVRREYYSDTGESAIVMKLQS